MADGASYPDRQSTITHLARLNAIDYDQERIREATRLEIQLKVLDAAVREARKVIKEQAAAEAKAAKAESEAAGILLGEERKAAIEHLADLDPLDYDKVRSAEAGRIGVRVVALDGQIKTIRKAREEAAEQAAQAAARSAEEAQASGGNSDLDQAVTVARLMSLNELSYERELPIEARRLGITIKVLDKAVRSERRQVAIRDLAEALNAQVEQFNTKYSVVLEGGKAIIYLTTYDTDLKREKITTITFEDMRKLYLNRMMITGLDAKGQPVSQNVADVWLKSPDRQQYIHGVVFDPSGKQQDGVLNLWKGFTIKPAPGGWGIMRDHIQNHICAGNKANFDFYMGWMARAVQFPGEPAEIAIVMRSIQGTGKGTVARAFQRIFGRHWMSVSQPRHLVGNFNWHLRDCVFLFADEAFFAGDKANIGALNAIITEPFLTLEGKGINVGDQTPNRLHVMMASNQDWVVPASADARRYFCLDVATDVVGNANYFKELNEQMEAGGYEAMLHDLLNYDLTDFDYRNAPKTEALREQQKLSIGTTDAWWLDVLLRGYVYQSRIGLQYVFMTWTNAVSTDLLHESYMAFTKHRNERHPISREALGAFMGKNGCKPTRPYKAIIGEEIADVEGNSGTMRKAQMVLKDRATGYRVGSLDHARAAFLKATGLSVNWGVSDEYDETADPLDD